MKDIIIEFALQDERIRAVLLNGSRANPHIKPDPFQDFDIVYIVRNFESFISDPSWTNFLGEKLTWQLPDEMSFGNHQTTGFSYLMLFKDGNRMDLTLFPLEKIKTHFKVDSLTIVWLDKDSLFTQVPPANDTDYHIRKPAEKEFLDSCNEFWWVSTNVAKGLLRNEIAYAKAMLETIVRPMFMKVIEWKIGIETGFSVSVGKEGKFLNRYLSDDEYNRVLSTYADAGIENNWNSLFAMISIFSQYAHELSIKLEFNYNKTEQQNVIEYLKRLHRGGENQMERQDF